MGHLKVLTRLADTLHDAGYLVEFAIVGWLNGASIPPIFPLLSPYEWHQFLAPGNVSTCPAKFNFARAALLDAEIAQYYRAKNITIDLLIYDFFAVEGLFLANHLHIPNVWCSVPAVPAKYENPASTFHANAIAEQRELFSSLNVNTKDLQPMSDGFLWAPEPRVRVIHWTPTRELSCCPVIKHTTYSVERDTFYISLGTVLTNNIWNLNPAAREVIVEVFRIAIAAAFLVKTAMAPKSRVVVSVCGNAELKTILESEFADLVTIEMDVDQIQLLPRCIAFISHGGGNSFSESAIAKCPFLVIPFFGDQHTTAEYAKWSWKAVDPHDHISTESVHLRKWENLNGLSLMSALRDTIKRPDMVAAYSWGCPSMSDLIAPLASIQWKPGDILLGPTSTRLKVQRILARDLGIGNEQPFVARPGSLYPAILDRYNDSLRFHKDEQLDSHFRGQLGGIKDFFAANPKYLRPLGVPPNSLQTREELCTIWNMCCGIIHHMVAMPLDGRTFHIVIEPDFSVLVNEATCMEMCVLWKLISAEQLKPSDVKFYVLDSKDSTIKQTRKLLEPAFIAQHVRNFLAKRNVAAVYKTVETQLQNWCSRALETTKCEFILYGRIKSTRSIYHRLWTRFTEGIEEIPDIIGFRISNPWTSNILAFAKDTEIWLKTMVKLDCLEITHSWTGERGKTRYLFVRARDSPTERWVNVEIQFWPTVLLTCLSSEHDTIYKPSGRAPTAAELETSATFREAEHALQTQIDENVLVTYRRQLS